jgi:hypothetical protein
VLPKAGFELEAIWDLPEIDFVSHISDRLMLDPNWVRSAVRSLQAAIGVKRRG